MRRSSPKKCAVHIRIFKTHLHFILLSLFYFAAALQADFQEDPFLGVYTIGDAAPSSGGQVQITNHEDITTDSTAAHGIEAHSSSPGYPSYVIDSLMGFTEQGFSFEVVEVKDAAGQSVDFGAEPTVEIRGFLVAVDAAGEPLVDDQGKFISLTDTEDNPIEHGTFVIGKDGTYQMSFSADETSEHNALASGESVFFAVRYKVLGENTTGITSQDSGELGVVIRANDEGELETRIMSIFSNYGISLKPSLETNPTLFPDLQEYVDEQLAGIAGGAGGAVTITSDGTIVTEGAQSHGIYGKSQGGRGGTGRTGSMWRSATAGTAGKTPGAVNVTANGVIETHTDESSGVVAVSAGGAGGAGGYGGWGGVRHGAAGGTGGDGGFVMVSGSARIDTEGDYASGIIALSVGGDGGAGGDGSGAMSGGRGGYGGRGGSVFVEGDWDITTVGDMSHGIWAKSLGGNAGDGGSGGWLFGDPGWGGQATDGGSVRLHSGGGIQTSGENAYGLYAQSVGGFGGDGGASSGWFWSFGGNAESGGSGGDVEVINDQTGNITTFGDHSHALFAQSIGGGGGSGGGKGAIIVSIGGAGASGGFGGYVDVENYGRLETSGSGAHGIFAQSVGGGGGDGGRANSLIAGIGGSGSKTSDGRDVDVFNRGMIITHGAYSHGIFAESVGGGGGSGGRSTGLVSIGGSGGGGGNAGSVTVINEGIVHTYSKESYGIFAQSVGGGGGSGGGAVSLAAGVGVSIGGKGAAGGHGDQVQVINREGGSITTEGDRSYGILAQSVGGGGGDGGFALTAGVGAVAVAVGGGGGAGGNAGMVDVQMDGSLTTLGEGAYGIFAQSVGGGGGAGGFGIAGTYGGSGVNVNLGLGGSGGVGGTSDTVSVDVNGTIETSGLRAHGVLAQSVGGGGGDGGFAVAGSIGSGTSVNLAFGGEGGSGNKGGDVNVNSSSTITTRADQAHGIFAQSLGGSGGSGGFAIAGSLMGTIALDFAFGGEGGQGGLGETVNVSNTGDITTFGQQSHGILAQSVGGGGGAGGLSVAGGLSAFGGMTFSMGGDGGAGHNGGDVYVINSGSITTGEDYSYGIFAQSVGGGGGAGGASGAVMMNYSSLIPLPPNIPEISVNFGISRGGDGGQGSKAGNVDVNNAGQITTAGDHAYGIFAQSVGGGGGDGGKSIAATGNISVPTSDVDPKPSVAVDFAMSFGGSGGSGHDGGNVDILNSGLIDTFGIGAHGIFAQSVGGGGGSGADARSMILSIDPSNWMPGESIPDPTAFSFGATLSMGGKGGAAGDSGAVTVSNEGTILTHGADAFGILAQSVGGGGGVGGSGYHGLNLKDFGVTEEYEELVEFILPVQDDSTINITVGGSGGSGGDGRDVTVVNAGDIITLGDGSLGVLAQSVGGGGGLAGVGATGGDGSVGLGSDGGSGGDGGNIHIDLIGGIYTSGIAAHGVFAQSVGGGGGYAGNVDRGIADFGINIAMSGGGGDGGDGGTIVINSTGDIVTEDTGAVGIFAQSVGGGGGLGGGIGFGFGFAGSVGDAGDGGDVQVNHTGNITTFGDYAHGIVAQSAGGADYGGDVRVTVSGDISVYGQDSLAVIAQSRGDLGQRDIDVIYDGGTITGNSDSAVRFLEGANNTFTNYGIVTTLGGEDGTAILTSSGNDAIHNHGTIFGSIDLGSGMNEFINYAGAVLKSGQLLGLGGGATAFNEGIFSPGGSGLVCATLIDGHLQQTASGLMMMDWDMRSGESDSLDVAQTADLAGQTQIKLLNTGYMAPGTVATTLVNTAGGVVDSGLSMTTPRTAVIDYDLRINEQDVQLAATMDAAPAGLFPNQQKMGEYINRIQASGQAEGFAPFAEQLFELPDTESLGKAYDQLGPAGYNLAAAATIDVHGQNTASLVKRMHSLRSALQQHDETMAVAQTKPNSVWIEGLGHWARQSSVNELAGYNANTGGSVFGYDYLLDEGLLAGFSFTIANTDVDMRRDAGMGDINSYIGAIYGSWFTDEMYVDAALSYGYHRFENVRYVQINDLSGAARSKHDGNAWSAYIESGFNMTLEDWFLTPFAGLRCTFLDEDSYRERGLPGNNIHVDGRTTESLVMDMGARFSRPFKRDNWVMVPEVTLAWNHDFDIDSRRLIAAFDSAPGMKFATDAHDVERNGIRAGLGVTMINKDHVSISINYEGEFRNNYSAHGLFGGIRVEF